MTALQGVRCGHVDVRRVGRPSFAASTLTSGSDPIALGGSQAMPAAVEVDLRTVIGRGGDGDRARKRKGAAKRRAALRRCRQKYGRSRDRAAQASAAYSPFVSSGSASGSWEFDARIVYKDRTTTRADPLGGDVQRAGSCPGQSRPGSWGAEGSTVPTGVPARDRSPLTLGT